jgi:zinc transport system ATP-binding protein
MAEAPLVAVEGVTVRLGGRDVLRRVSLSVGSAEIVTLVGPNGAGKTTLARVVLGLLAPSAGTVRRRPGLSIGYVPQRLAVDPVLPLTVRRLLSLTRRVPEAEARGALAETGAAALLDREVQHLSGGELQRVLLARALLRRPDLLVLDEPAQNVDFIGQAELYGLIGRLRERHGCAVLMISHDLHVVMSATDRVVCLNAHVCCAGAPEAVTRHPEYLALFGPRPAAQIAVYTHHHGHRHDVSGEVVPLPETAGPD